MTNGREAVITSESVLSGESAILYIDREGGTLQFLSLQDDSTPKVVSLQQVLSLDPALEEVLPKVVEGLCAVRDDADAPWQLEAVDEDDN